MVDKIQVVGSSHAITISPSDGESHVIQVGANRLDVVSIGSQGPAGVGVPTGGTTGQVLAKVDGSDFNTGWVTAVTGSVAWNDITGKPSTFTPSTHTHAIGDTTGLQAALDSKAATSHTHSISNVTGLQTELDTKVTSNSYFDTLAALLEPDALLPLRINGFSEVIDASTTYYVMASYYTRLGSSGRWEVRDPAKPMPLRGVTLNGIGSGATAILLDATLPTYTDSFTTYYNRLAALDTMTTQHIDFTAANQRQLFLPGAYGAIITSVTTFELAWIAGLMTDSGWNLANELGDDNADHMRVFNRMNLPVNKLVVNALQSSSGAGTGPLGCVTYALLPSTWSAVDDPNVYDFRDDFMGASINTGSTWTRSQSTAGNLEINTAFGWCGVRGDGANWGTNGMYSQASISRATGKVFLVDVYIPSNIPNVVVGFHDGSGQSYADFAHGIDFSTSDTTNHRIYIFEDGNSRGIVGSGYTFNTTYRVRITLNGNAATYEIQGGTEYATLGGDTWTDITPGTTSSSTTPLHAGVAMYSNVSDVYISDVRIY